MGYTTDFEGQFTVTPPLTPEQVAYLQAFNETRHMRRDAAETEKREDPKRKSVGLPVGLQGGYFVGEGGDFGQAEGADVRDGNAPPMNQPGIWCQWTASDDGTAIEWDAWQKFYSYVEWLEYLIEHFVRPWGRTLNGEVTWEGEDSDDFGKIVVKDNRVGVAKGERTYSKPRFS
jgi:hypothetical protein